MSENWLFVRLLFLPIILAFLISYLMTGIVRNFYLGKKWLDDPKKQTHPKVIHTYPVPRGGGIAIYSTVLICSLLLLGLDIQIGSILAGGLILAIVGFADDLKDLNPYLRLGLGFGAAACVVWGGIGIAFITNPFGPGLLHLDWPKISFSLWGTERTIWLLSDLFSMFWIVWTMNMVNWSKGLDGQLPGIVIVAALIIAILSFRFTEDITQWEVSILAAITAGAYLGFLPWNFYPQKIMPGYGGGTLAGYLLAVLAILSGAKVATMILVLGVPTMDAVYTVIRRIANKKSPVWGDRGHLHHRLLDFGWGKRRVATFYWLLSAFLGLLALQLNAQQKLFTIVTLALAVGGSLLWLRSFTISSKADGRDSG